MKSGWLKKIIAEIRIIYAPIMWSDDIGIYELVPGPLGYTLFMDFDSSSWMFCSVDNKLWRGI